MTTNNLSSIVDISVYISPQAAARSTFNQLLIIGTTNNITTADRLLLFESAADMITGGFKKTDPEYLAALLYFGQSPAPTKLWVGRQNLATSPVETPYDAIIACRAKTTEWYVGVCLAAVKADHEEIAEWAESAVPSTIYAYTTADADVPLGTVSPANIFLDLKDLEYSRSIGQYSTDNTAAICAIMGYAMGANNGLANSAYTLKFKQEVGVKVESGLNSTQINTIEGNNGNLYLNYANYYNIFEQGVMANGSFFDEKIGLDMLVNDIQLSVMDLLYQNTKIPQTEAGINQLVHAINQACQAAVNRGFLAPGVWTGVNVLNLFNGDTLPNGYLVQSESIASQSSADRQARKAPPIYVCIKLAGAVHQVTIGIYVNR